MKFTAHTTLTHDYEAHYFAPGDEVPQWAEGLVGSHVTDAGEQSKPKAEANAATTEDDGDNASDEPDFTSPAPRRSRSRKE